MTERVLLDACVIYPTLLRQLLVAAARAGVYAPLWSPQILDEWRHAAARSGPLEAEIVGAEIALLTAEFPGASLSPPSDLTEGLSLPDPDDRHVLAAAISAKADALLTANLKDFPTRTLGRYGILRYDPDGFFTAALSETPDLITTLRTPVLAAAAQLDQSPKALLKKSRLPKLAKRLGV